MNKESHNLNLKWQSKGANTDVSLIFQAAIIKMPPWAIKNMLGTNANLESLSKETKDERGT